VLEAATTGKSSSPGRWSASGGKAGRIRLKLIDDYSAATLRTYVDRSAVLKPETARLLEEALIRGEFERGEAPRITGLPERTARRVLNDAIATGLLASETPKGPLSLRLPVDTLDAARRQLNTQVRRQLSIQPMVELSFRPRPLSSPQPPAAVA
jgi:hypothetical protein